MATTQFYSRPTRSCPSPRMLIVYSLMLGFMDGSDADGLRQKPGNVLCVDHPFAAFSRDSECTHCMIEMGNLPPQKHAPQGCGQS